MGWDGMGWDGTERDGMGWDEVEWDGMRWDEVGWDGMGWDGMGWNGHVVIGLVSRTPKHILPSISIHCCKMCKMSLHC